MIKNGDRVRIIRPDRMLYNCIEWVDNFLLPVKKDTDEIMGEPANLNSIGKVICSGIYNDGSSNILLYGVRIGNKIYIMKTEGIRRI